MDIVIACVSDPGVDAIRTVTEAAKVLRFTALGGMDSPLPGARSGNVEHFLHLRVLE